MKSFSSVVLVMFAVITANATFHRKQHFKHYFTTDINGFHNHNHGAVFHQQSEPFGPPLQPPPVYGPPPPPVYGPPPFPHFHHHHHHLPHHHHKPTPPPEYNHNKPGDDGFGMTNLNTSPFSYNPSTNNNNPMPFIPNIDNPLSTFNSPIPSIPPMTNSVNFNPNFPYNPQNTYNFDTFNGGIYPLNTVTNNNNNLGFDSNNAVNNPTNLPPDPLPTSESTYDTNTIRPLDANTAFYSSGQSTSTSTPSVFDANSQPKYPSEIAGPSEATTSQFESNTGNNESNNKNGAATNNGIYNSINNQPGASEATATTTTASSTQGNFNGLDYDIDVRFGDSNNGTNQTSIDTIK